MGQRSQTKGACDQGAALLSAFYTVAPPEKWRLNIQYFQHGRSLPSPVLLRQQVGTLYLQRCIDSLPHLPDSLFRESHWPISRSLTWCFSYILATETQENKCLSGPRGHKQPSQPWPAASRASWAMVWLCLLRVTLPKPYASIRAAVAAPKPAMASRGWGFLKQLWIPNLSEMPVKLLCTPSAFSSCLSH